MVKAQIGRKGEETRGLILERSEDIILQKSYSSVGIKEVLEECRIPKGSFYHYFESKEDFGVQLLNHAAERYGRGLDELLSNDGTTGGEQLLCFFKFHIAFYESHDFKPTCLVSKLSSEVSTLSEAMREALMTIANDWTGKFLSKVHLGQSDGSISDAINPDALAQFLYLAWVGANTQVVLTQSSKPFESLVECLAPVMTPAGTKTYP